MWRQANHRSLNVSKTKETVVDFGRIWPSSYAALEISGTPVERLSSSKQLGVHITEDLTHMDGTHKRLDQQGQTAA